MTLGLLPKVDLAVWKPTEGTHTQSKVYRDTQEHILKYMRGGNPEKVEKEFSFLEALWPSLYFSQPLERGQDYIVMSDVGRREPVSDLEIASAHGLVILAELRAANIRHNDLRSLANVIVVNNVPHIVDFGWSQWLTEEPINGVYPDAALLVSLAQLFALARRIA